ncbi:hypothetical protein [Neolewinella litorea]|uniref:Uncharacterized protein n=1 Tax=Neolewinella litorea TaxID=2562452 RepID=A0A4S4N7Q5_9BACT|nr:hypothetical protein [Neolewinella litorea]THH34347.1 hypothetical protein E4021_17750 [Neolewinella litorea]
MKNVDAISKIVAALIAAGGFIWGIIEFQQRQFFNETHEFRWRLWEERLKVYTDLQQVSADIIIFRNDSIALDSLEEKLDRLYYSALVVVEDPEVEAKVIEYRESLNDFRQGIKDSHFLKRKQIDMMKGLSASLKKRQQLLFDD